MSRAVVPLESNPTVFSQLAYNLGLSRKFQFNDVYSLTDPDLLAFIPRPVKAIILLFPITENFEKLKNSIDSSLPTYQIPNDPKDEKIYWFPQNIKNACGLYALLHSIVNVSENDIEPDSKLHKFTKSLQDVRTTDQRTELIQNLENEYADAAQEGQTEAPAADDDVELHFISFVYNEKDGHLYELDGRRKGPIDLGKSVGDDVLNESLVLDRIQHYMDIADERNKLNYNLMALTPSFD